MNIENLVDTLDDMVENAWSLPLSGGKSVLDADKVKKLLEDMRLCFPKEFHQAKAIVKDRNIIIDDAKKEAEKIIRVAEERAKKIVDKSEIVKEAEAKANEMLTESQHKSKEMIKAANEYADDLMSKIENVLTQNLSEVKKTRKTLKTSQK